MKNQSLNNTESRTARIRTIGVPEHLRAALDSHELQKVTQELFETLSQDRRDLQSKRPVACPGAPYTR